MELGIDLGTANTVVSDVRRGIVFDEPSVMLLRRGGARRDRVLAVGQEAAELLGRAPSEFVAVRPLHDGVVTDLETARLYLRSVLQKAGRRAWACPVRAVIGVPVGSTALEHRALLEAAEEAGIRPVTALDESIAGAVGCGIDPLERRVHMVVDVGGGTAEAVAFCFGGVLAHRTSKLAGDEMTLAVSRYLREQHQLHVGELEAEDLKIRSGGGRGRPARRAGPRRRHRPAAAGDGAGGRGGRRGAADHRRDRPDARRVPGRPPPAGASPTCWRRACWCSAGPRWSAASRRSWNGVSACRSSSPRSPMTCVAEGAARALRNRPLLDGLRPAADRQGACTGPVARTSGRCSR